MMASTGTTTVTSATTMTATTTAGTTPALGWLMAAAGYIVEIVFGALGMRGFMRRALD